MYVLLLLLLFLMAFCYALCSVYFSLFYCFFFFFEGFKGTSFFLYRFTYAGAHLPFFFSLFSVFRAS